MAPLAESMPEQAPTPAAFAAYASQDSPEPQPQRQDFLEIGDHAAVDDDGEQSLATGYYAPPVAPPPPIAEPPAYNPAIQAVPGTLAGGTAAAQMPSTRVQNPMQGPDHYGQQSGRCPRCGLNLPKYRAKCPNCGAAVIAVNATDFIAAGAIIPKINVRTYELTKWPIVDFLLGILTAILLSATGYIVSFAPLILLPLTWMITRLFWRWFALAVGLATLVMFGLAIHQAVIYFQQHPIKGPEIDAPATD